MNGVACIDASVAVKWVVVEDDTESALRFLRDLLVQATRLIGPLHLKAEVTSAIYRRLRLGELVEVDALGAVSEYEALPIELLDMPSLSRRAIELSLEFGLKYPYDAMYLALGELLDCEVWTADQAFHSDAHSRYPRLRLLTEFEPG